jgi:hypothetical protein
MTCSGIETRPEKCSAPCPDDITCGVSSASRPTPEAAERRAQRRPETDRRKPHLAQRHPAHDEDAEQRRQNAEQRGNRKIAPNHVADRANADPERQLGKSVGDKITRHSGDTDRRQAGRRIASDHQFERIEGAGERRAERARDRSGRSAADHDALIGAAQVKSTAERSRKPARKLGISGFKADRRPDTAGPGGLQGHDDAAAKRHPPAMQRVGLDRVDLARRPPAQQQQQGHPQQQAAETWNQHGPQRLDTRLAGKSLRDADVEQQRVQGRHRHAHRQHHQARRWFRSSPPGPPGWSHGHERTPATGGVPQDNVKGWPFLRSASR